MVHGRKTGAMDHLGAARLAAISVVSLLGSLINLGGNGRYLHWHFINISVANLIVIGLMVVAFVLAIVLPFPHRRSEGGDDEG